MKANAGFTLIELLVVIGLISVLSTLGITSFYVYRSNAAYAVAERLYRDARNSVEASANTVDVTRAAVPLTVQNAQGPIQNIAAASFLPGLQIPRHVKFQVSYDPACLTPDCEAEFVRVDHCFAKEHVVWTRFGDGVEMLLQNVAGGGC